MAYNTKSEAIEVASEFLKDLKEIEAKHGLKISADEDIYLQYKDSNGYSDSINIGWIGDGTGLRITEIIMDDEYHRGQAMSKLSEKEIEALGLNNK